MDPDLILIFCFVTVALIVLGISVNSVVSKVLDYKRSHDDGSPRLTQSGDVKQLLERTEIIEDRLRVLERIATDRGHLLSDEIEALRDQMNTTKQLEVNPQ